MNNCDIKSCLHEIRKSIKLAMLLCSGSSYYSAWQGLQKAEAASCGLKTGMLAGWPHLIARRIHSGFKLSYPSAASSTNHKYFSWLHHQAFEYLSKKCILPVIFASIGMSSNNEAQGNSLRKIQWKGIRVHQDKN